MKRILCVGLVMMAGWSSYAQQKDPIYVDDASIFNYSFDPYYNYADQGQSMYNNTAQWQQKDNFGTNFPSTGNGQYVQPGNSNPINQQLYYAPVTQPAIIYSGYVPVREAGNNPSTGRDEQSIK